MSWPVVLLAIGVVVISGHALAKVKRPTGLSPEVATLEPVARSGGADVKAQSDDVARLEVLSLTVRDNLDQACSTKGGWCVSLTPAAGMDGLRTPVVARYTGKLAFVPPEMSEGESYAVWTNLVVLAQGRFIAGVETRLSTSYSGGGGSATDLRLFRVSEDDRSSAAPILTLPVQGSLLIRACFSEADTETRGEACHDEYGFTGTVTVEPVDGEMPVIIYATQAWAFPRGASRDEDSSNRGPLAPADLVRTRDDRCSFSRRFQFDDASGRYEADRPLPDCSAYTVP